MSIALPALAAAAIAHPADAPIMIRVPRQRQTIATPETTVVPKAR